MKWEEKLVLVTGGASFIGSHLVDALVQKNCRVRVVDDFSSGKRENIQAHLNNNAIELMEASLFEPDVVKRSMRDIDIVFHLAAVHGGRGYIDTHQADCSQNFILDGLVIREAKNAKVEKLVFASSGCVYPTEFQMDVNQEVYLSEDQVGPPYCADGQYGWAKLVAEMTLRAYYQEYGLKSVSCRFFTAYGERCLESHAVMALIARAFLRQNPFEVWGDGEQIRNWTHVSDIVRGVILAAETIDDARAVNLGTDERVRVIDAVREILRHTGHECEIKFLLDKPTGPLNRAASPQYASEACNWHASVPFVDGLHRTIDWYFAAKNREDLGSCFERRLTER